MDLGDIASAVALASATAGVCSTADNSNATAGVVLLAAAVAFVFADSTAVIFSTTAVVVLVGLAAVRLEGVGLVIGGSEVVGVDIMGPEVLGFEVDGLVVVRFKVIRSEVAGVDIIGSEVITAVYAAAADRPAFINLHSPGGSTPRGFASATRFKVLEFDVVGSESVGLTALLRV